MKPSDSTPESVNPYAAPQIDGGYSPTNVGLEGLWRDGTVLVMHRDAPLPPICVKSGQPATEWLKRDLQWQPLWVNWIIIALPAYVVLSLLLTRQASIVIGLSREWGNHRRMRMLVTAGIVAAGLALAIGGYLISAQQGLGIKTAFLLVPFGLVAGIIGGMVFAHFACRLVWPKEISGQFIWLKGVHPDFLKLLPEWPEGTV